MAKQMGFWGVVARSWASALTGVFHMPMLSVSAGIGLVLMGLADSWLFPGHIATLLGHNTDALHLLVLVGHMLLVAAVSSLITAPLAVAIHRFVLLGESDDRFFWLWRPEVRPFYLWVLLFNVLALLPELCQFLSAPLLPGLATTLGLVADVIVTVVSVRVMMIFPATAVNSMRATLKDCLCISRGHFWYFLGVLALVLMPVLIIFMLMIVTSLANGGRSSFELRVMADILALIFVPLLAAAASWLYRKFDSQPPADRTRGILRWAAPESSCRQWSPCRSTCWQYSSWNDGGNDFGEVPGLYWANMPVTEMLVLGLNVLISDSQPTTT